MNQKIVDYIEGQKENMLRDLERLVKIRSVVSEAKPGMPFGEESARAIKEASDLCEEAGLTVKNYDNYIAYADYLENPALAVLAHVDVVEEGDGWEYPPFECTLKDGVLYGRGVTDDKGPFISALYAIKCIKELGIPLKRGVRLAFGGGEEIGTEEDIKEYEKHEKWPEMVITPDAEYPCINIEKGRSRIVADTDIEKGNEERTIVSIDIGTVINAIPGDGKVVVRGFTADEVQTYIDKADLSVKFNLKQEGNEVTIEAIGKASHAAKPDSGNNVLTALLALLSMMPIEGKIGEIVQKLHKNFPYGDTCGKASGLFFEEEHSGATTVSFTVLHYHENHLNAQMDIRFPIGSSKAEMDQKVKSIFQEAGFNGEFKQTGGAEVHSVDENLPFVQTLLDVYHDCTGLEKKCITIGGGTYVHEIENGVSFGPIFPKNSANGNNIHGINEFADLDEFLMNAKILAEVIVKLCG